MECSDGVDSMSNNEGSEPELVCEPPRTTPTANTIQFQRKLLPIVLPAESETKVTVYSDQLRSMDGLLHLMQMVRAIEMEPEHCPGSAMAQEVAVGVDDAEEHLLKSLEALPLVLSDGFSGEDPPSPLNCTPLCMVALL